MRAEANGRVPNGEMHSITEANFSRLLSPSATLAVKFEPVNETG